MGVMDQQIDIRYLGFGLDPEPPPGSGEVAACCGRVGQTIDKAAMELVQGILEQYREQGLPGPVRFTELLLMFKTALDGVDLAPPCADDRSHWFMLRWSPAVN